MPGIDVKEEMLFGKGSKIKNTDVDAIRGTFSKIITNVLTERPKDALDLITDYIKEKKPKEIKSGNEEELKLAETQIKLFDTNKDEEEFGDQTEIEEEYEIPVPNCSQIWYMFEQASIGLGREELQRIFFSMKQLVFNYPLSSVRFWGKIFGTESNYLIAEAEYRDGEGEIEEEEDETEKEAEKNQEEQEEEEPDDGPAEESDIPKSTWKPPPIIEKEDPKSGVNKKVYFVCSYAGSPWIKLPHVTPEEICSARNFVMFFSGDLERKILSYPPFPGLEKNYLRVQIARISASTQISPAGFYMFDEDEEEEEEEIQESYILNQDFEGLSLPDLVEPSMSGWVHHTQYILPQGRCTWFDAFIKPEEDFEEDELNEEEEETQANNPKPEIGPQLLSSVSNDEALSDTTPAWSVGLSSSFLPDYAVAVAKSNLWPGAYAVAKGKFCENMYIGWGQKYYQNCFTPPPPPPVMDEYVEDETIREQDDPTVEEERAMKEKEEEELRAAQELENDMDDDDDD